MDGHPLIDLFEAVDLIEKYWNRRPGHFEGAVPVRGLIDEAEIDSIVDLGLLRWPYFTVVHNGVQPSPAAITTSRDVIGQVTTGYADPEAVRRYLAGGATLKLNQLEDWHLPTRRLLRTLEAHLPAELMAFVFYTPSDSDGMAPHRDASHVIALQLAGTKEWRLYADQVDSRAGLDVDASRPTDTIVTRPGDVLYVPHGCPHAATARDGRSLHLTFTITEPTPLDLVEAVMGTWEQTGPELLLHHHRMVLTDKARAVRRLLGEHLDRVDDETLTADALQRMRRRTA
jgi:ribosomal protein L16 Arg81 hydroxylase